jgi:hypothetical protein
MSTFEVILRDLLDRRVIIEDCTPNTPVSTLIEQFLPVAPIENKKQRIILTRDGPPLERGTLGENGVRKDTLFLVAYAENMACIHPDPIAPYLHDLIEEEMIEFVEPLENAPERKTHTADCTELLAGHNGWTEGEEYLFFVTDIDLLEPMSFPSDQFEMIHYVPFTDRYSPLNIILFPNGVGEDSTQEPMRLPSFSSVKGTFHAIKLRITKKRLEKEYIFKYQFHVILQGPIEFRDPYGALLRSLDAQARCMIRYDQIVRCNKKGRPALPEIPEIHYEAHYEVQAANAGPAANRNQGGRRSRRSKSKPKRKTRRTKRRCGDAQSRPLSQ